MIERTTKKWLSTPAVARHTARWAIESAASNPAGSYYALITAKVFTAFMFEGVVDHLGEILCSTWNNPRPRTNNRCPKSALSHGKLVEKHKTVRCLLQLANSSSEYQDIQLLVDRLLRFRHSFAHPKAHQQTIQDCVQSNLAAIPGIAWETEIDTAKIKDDYQKLETYSRSLLDKAAACLENTLEQGLDFWQQKYPHLGDLHREAVFLKGFLDLPWQSHSLSEYSQ